MVLLVASCVPLYILPVQIYTLLCLVLSDEVEIERSRDLSVDSVPRLYIRRWRSQLSVNRYAVNLNGPRLISVTKTHVYPCFGLIRKLAKCFVAC